MLSRQRKIEVIKTIIIFLSQQYIIIIMSLFGLHFKIHSPIYRGLSERVSYKVLIHEHLHIKINIV